MIRNKNGGESAQKLALLYYFYLIGYPLDYLFSLLLDWSCLLVNHFAFTYNLNVILVIVHLEVLLHSLCSSHCLYWWQDWYARISKNSSLIFVKHLGFFFICHVFIRFVVVFLLSDSSTVDYSSLQYLFFLVILLNLATSCTFLSSFAFLLRLGWLWSLLWCFNRRRSLLDGDADTLLSVFWIDSSFDLTNDLESLLFRHLVQLGVLVLLLVILTFLLL